jgi:hypothetical protein
VPKFIVYWWIRTDGKQKQGHDSYITEDKNFDKEDAETLIEHDLARDITPGSGRMFYFESQSAPTNLPNFYKAHSDFMISSTYAQVSNWGVRKVCASLSEKTIPSENP